MHVCVTRLLWPHCQQHYEINRKCWEISSSWMYSSAICNQNIFEAYLQLQMYQMLISFLTDANQGKSNKICLHLFLDTSAITLCPTIMIHIDYLIVCCNWSSYKSISSMPLSEYTAHWWPGNENSNDCMFVMNNHGHTKNKDTKCRIRNAFIQATVNWFS